VRRVGIGFVIVSFPLVLGVVFVPPVRTVALTVSLVPELINLPVRPLAAFAAEPVRITTSYGVPADRLDIYVPPNALPDGRTPAVILALGVHPEAIDDPNIVGIASAIARCGVVVGLPDSTALRELRVTPAEPAHLVEAALAVAARREVDGDRIGLAGFSAGASMALIAAADPRLTGRVAFVSDFGGYADAETLLTDVATRTMSLDGDTRDWSPDPGIRRDVAALLARAIEPPSPNLEPLLVDIAARDVRPTTPDPTTAGSLAGDARAAYLLFTAPDRPSAEAIVEGFSPALRTDLRGISPDAFAQRIGGPVFILHGTGDSAIPVAHAYALRSELPSALVAKVTIFGRFQHGQPGRQGLTLDDAADIWALTLYLHDIVAAATEPAR
jgi:dienelactone hydrolase